MVSNPKVTIACITYNHAEYIRQCLDGFLMQRCKFDYEIIISDDCSNDGTTQIIKEYSDKYPDLIVPIFHNENQYSKGIRAMYMQFVLPIARGEYVAICEGDDYWSDPYKLQKQVDFMDAHDSYIACFHNSRVIDDNNRISLFNSLSEKPEHSPEEIIKRHWFIATASLFFRNHVVEYPDWIKYEVNDDYALELLLASKGSFYYMDDVMSVYRLHQGSVSKDIAKDQIKMHDDMIALYKRMRPLFDEKYSDAFDYAIGRFEKGKARTIKQQKYPWLKFFKRSFYKRSILNLLGLQTVKK